MLTNFKFGFIMASSWERCMKKEYNNLRSVMHMPRQTQQEQQQFIEMIFAKAWTKIYFDFLDDKNALKRLYVDYGFSKNERYCNVLTSILSQPYKELGYYHGDDGKYVESFPPIRFPLTHEQAKLIVELDKVLQQYCMICNTLRSNDCLLDLSNIEKNSIISDIKMACHNPVNKRLNALERSFNIDLNECDDDLTDENDF